jgi:aspartyl-tRNA(Asn)/glutamyl-tRNA(Gln) amidotransferase subunit C
LPLSHDEVKHIATLARIGLSDEDIDRFADQLSVILGYFERLGAVDTSDLPPTAHTLPLHNIWRDDEAAPSTDKASILANAPLREGDHFRVSVILGE